MRELLLDAHEPSHRVYEVGGGWSPLAKVSPGETFALRTLDASGNQINESVSSQREIDADALFPATGQVEVAGVQAGQGLGIELVSLTPTPVGHLWTRPGLGFGPAPEFHVRAVSTEDLTLEIGEHRLQLARRLHAGTLGVAPVDATPARDVGRHGGNLDTHRLKPGATLWVEAQQDGAGIFAADVHGSIGDAEICGTGVETEATLELRAHPIGWAPELPTVTFEGRAWVLGVGDTVEDALDRAVRVIHRCVAAQLGVSQADAYLAVAALLQVEVCQVVNPHRSVAVSLGDGLDRCLVPPEALSPSH